jgi:hypothetical protein
MALSHEDSMQLLFHHKTKTGNTARIQNDICTVIDRDQVYITESCEVFADALVQYRIERPMVLISIGGIADFLEVKRLSDLLDDLFIMIVVAGNDKDVFNRCRQLYPRLLIHDDDNLKIVTDVIGKRRVIVEQTAVS